MLNKLLFLLTVLSLFSVRSQQAELPYDFRQHNLTEFNSSLLSPVFSLDRNNPQSVALWTRWQWQSVDTNPTTLFFNYTRKLNEESAIGGGFLQHNTGVFINKGAVLTYAYNFILNSSAQISLGLNVIGYQRKLAEDFILDPDFDFPQFEEKSNFILQMAPAVRLQLDAFSFGIAMENLVDRNFTTNESNASATGLIYMGLASYDFPITVFGDASNSYIRPTLYYKRLPDFDNQIGFNTFFSTPKFWAQAGYNSFYGISTGIGGRFFKKLSLGALVEFGTSSELKGEDPSIEIVTAFSFGKQVFEVEELTTEEELEEEPAMDEQIIEEEPARDEQIIEEERIEEELALLEIQRKKDSLEAVKAAELLALEQLQNQKRKDSITALNKQIELAKERELAEQKRKDSITKAKEAVAIAVLKEQQEKRRVDSLNAVKQAEVLAEVNRLKEQQRLDSINKAQEKEKAEIEVVELKKGEVYEEVAAGDGLEPGFYLIANVFGTKKYYEAFMKKLTDEGLQPKSFYRAKNKYNYVYLNRYDTMEEARKARDSKYGGRYEGKTWIYRVLSK